ncbi:MAG TPA: DUF3108 domain-containing protein [Terriglobales bacterium]|nr:DUF3108 domain-containing protein [Terriglobales bacterium]
MSFDLDKLRVAQIGGHWAILEGDRFLIDFGAQEIDARRALEVMTRYNADQWCSIGDNRGLQYLLVGGRPPVGSIPGEDCRDFNPSNLKVLSTAIVDGRSTPFFFESSELANQALQVIKNYGFNQSCIVGRQFAKFGYLKKRLVSLQPRDAEPQGTALDLNLPVSRPGELKLLPVPWKDGEIQEYTKRRKTDSTVYKIWRSFQTSGPDRWLFEEHDEGLFDRLEFAPESMAPANLFEAVNTHAFRANYQPEEVDIIDSDGKNSAPIALKGPAFDAKEIPAILPRLPWAKDYKVRMPVFWSDSGRVVDYEFAVTGEENIKVPAGEFHCYSVEENDLTNRRFALETFWISTDPAHLLVRNDHGDWSDELAALPASNPEPSVYQEEQARVSFQLPAGWVVEKAPQRDQWVSLHLLDLHSSAFVTLHLAAGQGGYLTPQQMRSKIEKRIPAGKYNVIRPQSWHMRQINGCGIVAWAESNPPSLLTYDAWVRTSSSEIYMFADADPLSFDDLVPKFEAIVDSIVLK